MQTELETNGLETNGDDGLAQTANGEMGNDEGDDSGVADALTHAEKTLVAAGGLGSLNGEQTASRIAEFIAREAVVAPEQQRPKLHESTPGETGVELCAPPGDPETRKPHELVWLG